MHSFIGPLHWFPIVTDWIVGPSPNVDQGLERDYLSTILIFLKVVGLKLVYIIHNCYCMRSEFCVGYHAVLTTACDRMNEWSRRTSQHVADNCKDFIIHVILLYVHAPLCPFNAQPGDQPPACTFMKALGLTSLYNEMDTVQLPCWVGPSKRWQCVRFICNIGFYSDRDRIYGFDFFPDFLLFNASGCKSASMPEPVLVFIGM